MGGILRLGRRRVDGHHGEALGGQPVHKSVIIGPLRSPAGFVEEHGGGIVAGLPDREPDGMGRHVGAAGKREIGGFLRNHTMFCGLGGGCYGEDQVDDGGKPAASSVRTFPFIRRYMTKTVCIFEIQGLFCLLM
ncbi:MAG: hypothetical protein WDN49_09935 [Acetobacteraceae bacterium]